jgi:high-affinity iron transporter
MWRKEMNTFLPGLIMGFREGLEAFLIVVIILQYLNHIKKVEFKKYVYNGAIIGIILSAIIGGLLFALSDLIGKTEEISKLWESGASLVALVFITTFIYWMIKHGRNMVSNVQNQVSQNLSKYGLFSIAFIMVIREGAEIAIFTFAGKYTVMSITLGITLSLLLAILIYKALVKVNLKLLFNITLGYLILQAGFLLGYSVHEGLSALKALSFIDENNILLVKAFDLSKTFLNHKEGIIGLPLYVLFGWYSKPEWLQFALQYSYTFGMLTLWYKSTKKNS